MASAWPASACSSSFASSSSRCTGAPRRSSDSCSTGCARAVPTSCRCAASSPSPGNTSRGVDHSARRPCPAPRVRARRDRGGPAAGRARRGRGGGGGPGGGGGGRLVGDIQGRYSDQAMPPGVWELGIELWDEADRRRGYGREACALLTSHLFDAEGAIRGQATTDVDNAAMRPTFEKVGFGCEGILRGFMPQSEGEPRDYARYARTKQEHTRDETGL